MKGVSYMDPKEAGTPHRTTVRHRYQIGDRTVRHVHQVGRFSETATERHSRIVREFIAALDIPQTAVAQEAGMSPEHLNRVLHGRYPVSADLAAVLSRLTGARPGLFVSKVR